MSFSSSPVPGSRLRRLSALIATVLTAAGLVAFVIRPGHAEPQPKAAKPAAATVTNPLVEDAADPWLEYFKGNYYLAYTTWSSQLVMRKSPTVAGLKTAKPVVIWSDTTPERCCNFWAPEFRLMKGPNGPRWYLTFTAGTENKNGGVPFVNQHTQVLESAGNDPMGPYSFKNRILDPQRPNDWMINGSYLELNDSLYYLWSGFDGKPQNLYIAKMSNPWTISSPRTLLSTATHDWEKSGNPVNEGPVAVQHNGKTFVVYSASSCETPDYQLGQLAFTGGDPLAASSWSKKPTPIFTRNDEGKAFGPGHNGFFTSPDGKEDWIVYHANSKSADKCGRNRSTRVQKITWNADGSPNLGTPAPLGSKIAAPSGEDGPINAPVRGVAYNVVNVFSGKCLETTLGVLNPNSNVAQHACSSAAHQQWVLDDAADGSYRLVNKNSRRSLTAANCGTANGTNVVQSSWKAGACQRWKVTPAGDGWVRIDDANSGKTLDVEQCFMADDVNVRLWEAVGNSPCQRWRLQPVGEVGVSNVNNGKLLGFDCSAGDGAAVTTRAYDPGVCEKWSFTSAGGADYTIKSAQSGKCLSIAGRSTADGATTEQRACAPDKDADQKWYVEPQVDGTFRIANRGSGKNLDVAYCGLAEKTKVGQFPWLNNDCQRFRLTNLDPQVDAKPTGPTYPDPWSVSGDTEKVHDPSMIKTSDGTYILASTGTNLIISTSPDGRKFTKIGSVFPNGTPWADEYLPPPTAGKNRWLWAPDISFHDGKYYLYYAASSFGSSHSAIFLATSPTGLPGTWTHVGKIIETGETSDSNAIDPNLLVDAQGRWWLDFGSFWTGIKMIRIDPKTGLRDSTDSTVYSLAGRPDLPKDKAIEAPFIYRHSDYYYLFVSYDWCCKGTSSTYRTMVGRSKNPTGPYLDRNGRPMAEGGATELLATHDSVGGPGHQAVMRDGTTDVLVYHYYWNNSVPDMGTLGMNKLEWDADGWPVVSAGEPPSQPQPPSPAPPGGSTTPSPSVLNTSSVSGMGGMGGGELPVTGNNVVRMVGLGAALLAFGAVLYPVSRRRRPSTTGPE